MPKKPGIGAFRDRITIETLSVSSDSQGGSVESWSTFATCYAKIDTRARRELYFAEGIRPIGTHRIYVRWIDGLSEKMRVKIETSYRVQTFQIKGISWIDDKRFIVMLDCEENVGT